MKNKTKSINLALKINIAVFLLIISYILLDIAIIKGSFGKIEPFLMLLFLSNCFVVGAKIWKSEKA